MEKPEGGLLGQKGNRWHDLERKENVLRMKAENTEWKKSAGQKLSTASVPPQQGILES
jgi:hypothetical protein